jgi:membrane fusion protein, multidrug efflux system
MKKKILFVPPLILALIMTSCGVGTRSGSSDPAPASVTLYHVSPERVSYYDTYPGTVTALKEVGLRGQVTGYITGIYFTEGSRVRQGQKLYEIDRRQYEAAFREASDNLKIAQENLAKVQRDVDRYTALNNQEAIARQQYDNSLTDLANARSQVSLADQELVKARTNLEYSLITAPFDGTIGISQVKLGDLVTPGQTILNTISSDDPMGVDFEIGQNELGRFQQLELRTPVPGDSAFRLVMPDDTLYQPSGKIALIDRAVDPRTGTITVRLVFPNPDRGLRPGMNCNVWILHESKSPEILIPFRAVLEQMGEYFVFLAENNKAKEVKVSIGTRVGSGVIIRQGLSPGDVVIVEGIEKLTDGTAITTGAPQEQGYTSGKK